MSVAEAMKTFIGRQTVAYKVLAVKKFLDSFFSGFTSNYVSIYIVKLGADPVQLGGLNSLGSLVSALASAPMGWLVDCYSARKVYLAVVFLSILFPLSLATSTDWRIAVVPMALYYLTMVSSMVVENVILANSLRRGDRATGMGLTQSLAGVAMIVSPAIAGFLLDKLGGLQADSIRLLFLIQLAGSCLTFTWILLKLKEIPTRRLTGGTKFSFPSDFREVLSSSRSRRWLLVESLGSLIFGMIIPFIYVYAAEIKHADAITLGLMGSAMNLTYTLSALPLGRLADRVGRRKAILLLRPTLYLSMLLLILAPSPEYLILAMALRGLTWGGSSAYFTLALELVRSSQRGRWSGVIQTLRSLARVPAPLIGGLLWSLVDPSSPFIAMILLDLAVRLPLIASTPETLELHG